MASSSYLRILVAQSWRLRMERRHDLPKSGESERHYLTHRQLLDLARENTGSFETVTLVLGYCGLRFGEAAALRRKDIGDQEITIRSSATYVARQGILETGTKTNRSRHISGACADLGVGKASATSGTGCPGVPVTQGWPPV